MSACKLNHFKEATYNDDNRCRECGLCNGCRSMTMNHDPLCMFYDEDEPSPVWTISATMQPDGLYHVKNEKGGYMGGFKNKPLAKKFIESNGATYP